MTSHRMTVRRLVLVLAQIFAVGCSSGPKQLAWDPLSLRP